MEIRELGPDDAPSLRSFPCSGRPTQVWMPLVQEMITTMLGDALTRGDARAIGRFDGDLLVGLIAWTPVPHRPDVWRSALLAVRDGCRRKGHARELKAELLSRARQNDISAVVSTVHFMNDAMIELNLKFGATIDHFPGDPHHLVCTVVLQ